MKSVGADSNLCAKAELAAISEARGCIPIYCRRIDGAKKLLCRLRDVSEGGARLAALPADAAAPGRHARVLLSDSAAPGALLEAAGRIAWAAEGEVGVQWDRGDRGSDTAVARMLRVGGAEWRGAHGAAHPRSCRCMKGGIVPDLLLLG